LNSDPNIRIRLAEADDAAAIASLMSESFIEYRPLYTLAGYAATAITSEQVADRIREGPVWVAERNEMILGTVSVITKGDSLYVRGMAVLPTARGQRLGELLIMHVGEFALSKPVRRLFLSTTPFLDRAIRLYEKFGFRRTNEGPHDLFGTPLFTMEKMIAV
jgi:N-acetylglutamate synthase-like GNAT family acetyltransferase